MKYTSQALPETAAPYTFFKNYPVYFLASLC